MTEIIPIFSSHYGLDSILTLEEAGKTPIGNPTSIVDIARANHLQKVTICDGRIDGFLEAFGNLSKPFSPSEPKTLDEYLKIEKGDKKSADEKDKIRAQTILNEALAKFEAEKTWFKEPIALQYSIKLVVVPDMADKTQESMRAESKIVIFLKDTNAYKDVLKIWNKAWVDGHFNPARESGYGRIDWKTLKSLWTPNLGFSLPYFSSLLAVNSLNFASIVPDFPVPNSEIVLLKEVESGLPFADLLDETLIGFSKDTGASIQPIKTIYYHKKSDFTSYMVYRTILTRGEFSRPEINDFCSDKFCFEEWVRLSQTQEGKTV